MYSNTTINWQELIIVPWEKRKTALARLQHRLLSRISWLRGRIKGHRNTEIPAKRSPPLKPLSIKHRLARH